MSRTEEVLSLMNTLKDYLVEERTVLINHDGERLLELVNAKEETMNALAQYDESEIEIEQLNGITLEIKSLQETNVLLTEQSISFTDQLVSNIQKNATKKSTYSKKGTFDKTGQNAFIDQSL